jgi:hypothetical protein
VLLKGEQTGYQLSSKQIKVPNIPQTLKADQIVKLPLSWETNKIPPDRYTGAVYLSLEGGKERLIIPVNLTMRIAPLMPLFILFLGIICGRLTKYMQEKGIPQAEILGKVKELEKQVLQADPFSDYLGLLVWGLSADVASRSLSNLAGEEEKKE